MIKGQEPCPRCGSEDIKYKSDRPCLCRHPRGGSCWSYPICRRCGYTNINNENSDGTCWENFGGIPNRPLDITPEVQAKIDKYERKKAEESNSS